jgi:hypothetical protein
MGEFAYAVLDRHHFFVLKEGDDGFRNTATIRVQNLGDTPIWCNFGNYGCSVYTEGVDVLYTNPILPGAVRKYVLVVTAEPYPLPPGQRRPYTGVLKSDWLGLLQFAVNVYGELPDGLETVGVKTEVYCAYLLPKGFAEKHKIVRHLE